MNDTEVMTKATAGLKMLAADPRCREAFLLMPLLQQILEVPASRYIVASSQQGLWKRLVLLADKRYRLGVEYAGEEVENPEEISKIVDEYLALVETAAAIDTGDPVQLGFDLSNVGLLRSKRLAHDNTARILAAAAGKGIRVVISMERSSFVEDIIDVFVKLAEAHENVALTLQAHLHRTESDLEKIVALGRKVRLVKGVYRESPEIALCRGPELDERYLRLLEYAVGRGVAVACATHDRNILLRADQRGLLAGVDEIEMLHGVRPALLKSYHDAGLNCRISSVYGMNWWLHFLHRLAEYPPMMLVALADLADPGRIRFGAEY